MSVKAKTNILSESAAFCTPSMEQVSLFLYHDLEVLALLKKDAVKVTLIFFSSFKKE